MNKQLLSDFLNQVEKLENLDRHDCYHENGIESDDISKNGRFMEAKEINEITAQMRIILSKFTIDEEKA